MWGDNMDEDEKIEFVKNFLNGLKSVIRNADTYLRAGFIRQCETKMKAIENSNVVEEHKKILTQALRQQLDVGLDTSEILSRMILKQLKSFASEHVESICSGSLEIDCENGDKIDLDIESLTLSITKKFEKE